MKHVLPLRRALSLALTLVLLLGLVPPVSAAAPDAVGSYFTTGQTQYQLAPGVVETELFLNTDTGMSQNSCHLMEIDLSDPTVSVLAGYRNYDGSAWGMQSPTLQAARAEAALRRTQPTATVVGVMNASFYNMNNGAPVSALVMNGQVWHDPEPGYGYLAILNDGTAQIRDGSVPLGDDVAQAVGGSAILVSQGQVVAHTDDKLNPRSAVGVKADGSLVLFENDGRQKPNSMGLIPVELGKVMQSLGCVDALLLDGGGSSAFCTRRADTKTLTRRSSPSDGYERPVSATLLVVSADPDGAAALPQPDHTHAYVYDQAANTLTCACGDVRAADGWSGFAENQTGGQIALIGGRLQTDWFTWGDQLFHAGSDGVLHTVKTKTTRTCMANGYVYGTCQTCGKTKTGNSTFRSGHTWDENHVCTVCGAKGKDIQSLKDNITGLNATYTYNGYSRRPTPTITDGDYTLVLKNSYKGDDGFINWSGYEQIGTAVITIEARGNYYGVLELSYDILPPVVRGVQVTQTTADAVTLSWDAAIGAQCYAIFLYSQRDRQAIEVACTQGEQTSYTLTGLSPDTEYSLCVKARGIQNGKNYDSATFTWVNAKTQSAETDDPDGTVSRLVSIQAELAGAETLSAQLAGGRYYLYLPAFADPASLPLRFVFSGEEPLTVSGSKQSLTPDGESQTLDLGALTEPDSRGAWVLRLQKGELAPMELHVLRSSVPAMFIHSSDPAQQGRTWIDQSKDHASKGQVKVLDQQGAVRYDGAFTKLKARGNTTFTYAEKKSYQIKLDKKADLIDLGEKLKTWVLLAGYVDASQMHDKTLKDLAAALEMPFTPRNDWVDLYYDGEYRGTYLLGEKNAINSTSVDITDLESLYEDLNPDYGADTSRYATASNRYGNTFRYTQNLTEPENVTGGFLLELNHNFYDEVNGFLTTQKVGFNVKSPEWAGKQAMTYISEYYQAFEDAVYAPDHSGRNPETGKFYYEYVDLQSLVQVYLMEQLGNNVDGFVSSFYFYKDKDQIMYAGPVWDLDNTCGTGWGGYVTPTQEFMNARYLASALSKIPSFRKAVEAYYDETFRPLAETLPEKIRQSAAYLTPSVTMNYTLWPYIAVSNPASASHVWKAATYPLVIGDLDWWLRTRLQKLDEIVHTPLAPVEKILPFTDVKKDDYFFDAVYWAYQSGVTAGVSAKSFAPGQGCTRAQVVTFLWRAAGSPQPAAKTCPFADVKADAYFAEAVTWAVEQGITQGVEKDRFGPDEGCTRAQVVTFLWRFAHEPTRRAAVDPTPCPPVSEPAALRGNETAFTDVPAGAYYAEAVAWAVSKGITQGTDPGKFSPTAPCTRAQIVTFLYRALAE